jgi:signal transduction histidine kinase
MIEGRASGHAGAQVRQLAADEHSTYFFAAGSADVSVLAVDAPSAFAPAAFRQAHPCRTLIAVTFHCGDTWHGRVFLLDPDPQPDRAAFLDAFERLLRQLLPALARLSDLHALRHRAAARERARIARELHDGLVQGLANIDMELELIRTTVDPQANHMLQRLEHVQQRLRSESRELRTLLQRERSNDIDASRLPAVIEDIVERFGRDMNIHAKYVSQISDIRLSPQVCGEIARIVQEALVNVRRHSGARHVVVSFTCARGEWRLSIEDDGRGFKAARGRTSATSTRTVRPPSVIHERARSIGGTVRVVAPGRRGARLEIAAGRRTPWAATR